MFHFLKNCIWGTNIVILHLQGFTEASFLPLRVGRWNLRFWLYPFRRAPGVQAPGRWGYCGCQLWTPPWAHTACSLSCLFCFSISWRTSRIFKLVLSFMAAAIASKEKGFFLMPEKLKKVLPSSSQRSSEQSSLRRLIYKGIKKSKSNKVLVCG